MMSTSSASPPPALALSSRPLQRLDRWLTALYPKRSRCYFQALIDGGHVTVNGQRAKKCQLVGASDAIAVEFVDPSPVGTWQPEEIALSILYEDEALLVIDKPAGLVTHPGAGNWSGTLANALLHRSGDSLGGAVRSGIVHRLDKATSGVLITAKTEDAQRRLLAQFARREIQKQYLAVTHRPPRAMMANYPVIRDRKYRQRMAASLEGDRGKAAETRFELLARQAQYHLLRARPVTGRTHQIRVHLKALAAPIVGDLLYGGISAVTEIGSVPLLLHAHRIALKHPLTGEPLSFEATPPSEFSAALRSLGLAL